MSQIQVLSKKVDNIIGELVELKRDVVKIESHDQKLANEGWNDLRKISKKITRKWKGSHNAVEEIRSQREK